MGGNNRNVPPVPKVYETASVELREIRKWLRATYGGNWGGLYSLAIQVEKMEGDITRKDKKIKRLETRLRALEVR